MQAIANIAKAVCRVNGKDCGKAAELGSGSRERAKGMAKIAAKLQNWMAVHRGSSRESAKRQGYGNQERNWDKSKISEGNGMGKRERARKSSAERTRMRRRSRQNKSSMACISLIVLMLVGVMSVQIVSAYSRNQSYQAQEEELEAQLESEKARKKELEEYKKYVNTKEYIEQVAKAKLGLVYPNEVIYKEKEDSGK